MPQRLAPADYLKDGKNSYFGLKFGYDGEWKGLLGGVTAAFGGDHWSGLVNVNHHQGQETDNKGTVRSDNDTRTASNPQDRDGRSLLSKLVYAPSEDQRFRLTVEGNEDTTDTNVLSAIASVAPRPGSSAGLDRTQTAPSPDPQPISAVWGPRMPRTAPDAQHEQNWRWRPHGMRPPP